jgi:hypothetical protein
MPLNAKDVESKLLYKFKFTPAKNHESGHRWVQLKINGIPTIFTKISHGKDDICDKILSAMANQLHVKKDFFFEMIKCTKSRDEYIQTVATNPTPPFPIYRHRK